MRKPLEGLFVVEMTSYWSATTTARFLRDMGARVVRVETPPIGDFCRYYGRSMGMPITAEENPIHDIFNGGKECVALDLKDPKNLKLMQNMLAKADVFITSTRTAGLKKLGLDWETLHAKYPKLVMGQVTGYGINGPLVNRPGIDAIAYFGANGVILDTRTDPDSPPIYPPAGMGDTTTGITLLSGVLAALLAARETGVGDYVMTSLYGTGNFVTAGFATNCNYGYEWPREAHTMSPLGQGYHYSKYYLNDMLECYREKFALDDVIVRYLDQLAGERGYSNSNLLLLYHYLNTERNISLTAKRVHMHRNSVIYRLQRIQDVLNLDLDDPDVRLRLMITFKILRMEGKLPEITDEPPEPDNGGSDRLTLVE